MSAGRRGSLLSVAFALLALGLSRGPQARAQPVPLPPGGFPEPGVGQHAIWNHRLAPEQIRQMLARFGQGDKDANRLLEDLIRDSVAKKNPGSDPKQIDATIKKLMSDKEFMNRVTDLAQKYKNQFPDRDPNAKIRPEEVDRDLARLKEAMRREGRGDPFKVPEPDPNRPGKFDPKTFDPKNFDPKQFPHADPKNPPRIDRDSGLPLDPRTGEPFDPRSGTPLDPRTGEPFDLKGAPGAVPKLPPRLPPVPPPVDNQLPPAPPDPDPGRPPDAAEPDPFRKFDPNNPLGPPKDSPEKIAKAKAYDAAAALWEKNVGPLDESPAVKRAIYDLISDREAMDALTDSKGHSIFDMLKDGGDGEGLKDLFGGSEGKGWEWPKFDWSVNWGKNSSGVDFGNSPPRSRWSEGGSDRWPRGAGSWGGSFNFGGTQVPWAPVLLLLAVVVAVVLWWKWEALARIRVRAVPVAGGLGAWPVDPHGIGTREDVVKAFEYLSVLICGPGARTWTHSTVADELTALAATHGGAALKLARLYELARYAPLDEPLTRAELIEARRLVCDLAGMD